MIGMPMIDRKDSTWKLDILVDISRTETIIRMNDAVDPNTQKAASNAFCGGRVGFSVMSAIGVGLSGRASGTYPATPRHSYLCGDV
jgi:hypothetical protein